MSRERKRSDVAALAWSATLLLVGGCASVPPKDYRIGAGGVGVAVANPSVDGVPTAGGSGASGAVWGALASLHGAAYVGPGIIVFAPILAIVGSVEGAACGKKFTDAYPALPDAFAEVARREFRPDDVARALVAELRQHTSMPVVAMDAALPVADGEHVQALLSAAAQRELAYTFVVSPALYVEPASAKCDGAKVGVRFDVALWDVAGRKEVGLRPRLSAWRRRDVSVEFGDLQVLLSEPGALQSRLQPQYGSWASDLYFQGGFELPGR